MRSMEDTDVKRISRLKALLPGFTPAYETDLGAAYCGEAEKFLAVMPDSSADLIVTSPPFALRKKKEYGNVDADHYVEWFHSFACQFYRVLKDEGSLVVHLGGAWERGRPTRSLYQYELPIDLCKKKADRGRFYLAQEFFWYNPAKLPAPAEWVTIRRLRCKDAVDPVWWLSKTPFPTADNKRVLVPYSNAMRKLLKNGYNAGPRPSGYVISDVYGRDNGGAIPPNLLSISNTDSNSAYLRACRVNGIRPHPARYPIALARFFIDMVTVPGDLVLDPFSGSNSTGEAAERGGRCWLSFEKSAEYVKASKFRFLTPQLAAHSNGARGKE